MIDGLNRMIEAVEAGTLDAYDCGRYGRFLVPYCNGKSITLATTLDAYHGSADAAIALFEALLPEWAIASMAAWPGKLCTAALFGTHESRGRRCHDLSDGRVYAEGPTVARALLLAVLRAKLVEMVRHE